MKISVYIDRINLLHKLISEEKTGTPEELARRLGLCESRLYSLLDELKLEDVPISYSRKKASYYYEEPFIMKASIVLKPLNDFDTRNIIGGRSIQSLKLFSLA